MVVALRKRYMSVHSYSGHHVAVELSSVPLTQYPECVCRVGAVRSKKFHLNQLTVKSISRTLRGLNGSNISAYCHSRNFTTLVDELRTAAHKVRQNDFRRLKSSSERAKPSTTRIRLNCLTSKLGKSSLGICRMSQRWQDRSAIHWVSGVPHVSRVCCTIWESTTPPSKLISPVTAAVSTIRLPVQE